MFVGSGYNFDIRSLAILDGFLADVVAGAVIDFAIRPLADAENHDQAAARLHRRNFRVEKFSSE